MSYFNHLGRDRFPFFSSESNQVNWGLLKDFTLLLLPTPSSSSAISQVRLAEHKKTCAMVVSQHLPYCQRIQRIRAKSGAPSWKEHGPLDMKDGQMLSLPSLLVGTKVCF